MPSSLRPQQEPFTFPDLAICVLPREGCLTYGEYCFDPDLSLFFLNDQFVSSPSFGDALCASARQRRQPCEREIAEDVVASSLM